MIYSKGAFSWNDLHGMTPFEFDIVQKRLNKYFDEKAKAMKDASSGKKRS